MRCVVWAGLPLVVAVLLTACGGAETLPGSGGSTPAVTGPTTKTQREALAGQDESRTLAPDVAGTTLAGESISLADLRGRPVFVKVFGGY